MSLTQEQIAERDASAKSIVESWYWQAAEGHNYRNANAAKTMTLFYESAPLESDILKLVIEWLRTRTGLTQLVVNHKEMTFDAGWDAADAWFATAPGDKWQGTESNRVRLYWVLVQAGEATGDGYHIVENGCRYKVEHKFFWDVKDAPTATQGSSGVSYTIQGLTRDRQTGLYSYVEEKRTRIQQDVAEYTSSITEFEEQKVEQHIGVDQQHEASAGQAASVSDGTIVERIEEKNEDCTKNITNRKRIEKEVDGAQITVQKTLRGTRTRTLHRNQTAQQAAQKIPVTIPDGTTVVTEKTPGKRTDITIEENTANENNTPISSVKEVSSGVTTQTDIVSMPNEDAATDQQTALQAETNKVKQITYRKNEDGVTTDKQTSTTTYTSKDSTEVTWSDDEYNYKRRSYRDNPSILQPTEISGQRSISFTPNDHNSWNGEYQIRTPKLATGDAATTGIKIIDEDKDVWYEKKRISGHWVYQPDISSRRTIHEAWLSRRFCKLKERFIGMTLTNATNLRNALAAAYTRSTKTSIFTADLTSPYNGMFHEVDGGAARMARIYVYHIDGDVYGVAVDVNEVSERLDLVSDTNSPSGKFTYEDTNWAYP